MLARWTALIERLRLLAQNISRSHGDLAQLLRGGGGWVGARGGELAQSEINNFTLIHHKPVITARPPVAKAFHSERLQKVGGGLLLCTFMLCLGISIFKLALHSNSISFEALLNSFPTSAEC